MTVLADGVVRSGLDVVRMLALSGDAVVPGRARVCALAANSEAGVAHKLRLLQADMRIAMARTGTVLVIDINANVLMNARRDSIQQE